MACEVGLCDDQISGVFVKIQNVLKYLEARFYYPAQVLICYGQTARHRILLTH
jgi:hypothetical protein